MPIPHRATALQALKFYMLVEGPAVNNGIDLPKMNEGVGEDRLGNSLKHMDHTQMKYQLIAVSSNCYFNISFN